MNQILESVYRLLQTDSNAERLPAAEEKPISTAAVPSKEESTPLHVGRRRIKESYTSHWDLDYLPRKEVEEILAGIEREK
jgi:hypothetical protein